MCSNILHWIIQPRRLPVFSWNDMQCLTWGFQSPLLLGQLVIVRTADHEVATLGDVKRESLGPGGPVDLVPSWAREGHVPLPIFKLEDCVLATQRLQARDERQKVSRSPIALSS